MVIAYAYDDVEVLGLPLVPVTALLCNPTPGPTSVVLCAPEFALAPGAVCAPIADVALAPAGFGAVAPPVLTGVVALPVLAAVDVVP